MITILAIFCQLAFFHVNCAPKSSHDPQIDDWWLSEVFIKWESTLEPTDRYTRKVKLFRYDNGFCIDTLRDGNVDDKDRKIIMCFNIEGFYAFLDDELYAIRQHPFRAIRMTLADKKQARMFKSFFEPPPAPHIYRFGELKKYYIYKLVLSDGLVHRHYQDDADHEKPITLTVYAGLDRDGNETEDRRFIISGGEDDQLFAVFNRDEFISIQKGSSNRILLMVHPPGRFWGKFYIVMKMLYFRGNMLDKFTEEMSQYSVMGEVTPETSTSRSDNP